MENKANILKDCYMSHLNTERNNMAVRLEKAVQKLESGERLNIVALGDSLTYGWMVRKGYLDFFKELIQEKYPHGECVIHNRGIPGDTAEGGLQRLRHDVIDEDPDLVFIQFGLNDAFSGVSPVRFEHALRTMVSEIRASTEAEILILTSVPVVFDGMDSLVDEIYRRCRIVAEQEQTALAEVHRFWQKRIDEGVPFQSLVQFDQVHPTTEGYRYMAEAIIEVFV